jgi:hypothetical protein
MTKRVSTSFLILSIRHIDTRAGAKDRGEYPTQSRLVIPAFPRSAASHSATCRGLPATPSDFFHRDHNHVWTLPMNRAEIRMRPDEESRFGDRSFKRPSLAKRESWLACMTANP